ncbi:MAG: hypothetical protein KME13_24190 [Myxacorys californica WJT36-NPBG1]|jgi:hypothetical protein|nr:hypothetical protein [Myxacorys californica WJT36-NPBG1]
MIEIIDLGNVLVDGANFGAVADAIANNPKLASPIQTALQQWWEAKQQAFEAEKADIASRQQQAVEAAIANAKAQSNVEMADYKAQIAAAIVQSNAEITDYQTQIATLTQELDSLKNPPLPVENWAGLASVLINSSLLLKVQQVGTVSGAANMGYTSLGFVLFGIRSYERFVATVKVIRLALAEVGQDFTPEELSLLDRALVENGFPSLQIVNQP